VTIEGCGKDLATKGGSRDRSDAISRQVFEREPPVNVAYEFLNVGGRKMSTSQGRGAAAHEIADLLPPELLRFLFLRHRPGRALDFNPEGDTIPGLFDEFDRIAAAAAGDVSPERKGTLPPDAERIFALSLVDASADPVREARHFRPPFRHLAVLIQVPGVDLEARMTAEKGAPLDPAEREILEARAEVCRRWLADFAPERYRIEVSAELPLEAGELDEPARRFLTALADAATLEAPDAGSAWQDLIFRTSQGAELASSPAFTALYVVFLGRSNGPRAGWLLASLDPTFVIGRLREAAAVRIG
jgi:lysyl-tRNA synthetase class 1